MTTLRAVAAWFAHWWSNPFLRTSLGAVVSVVFLVFLLRAVPAAEVWRTLGRARPTFVILALFSVAVNTAAKAVRWRVLMGTAGRDTSLWELLRALMIGQVLNTFIPTRIGDLSRAYTIGRRSAGIPFVLGTVVIEKLIDMSAFALLVLLVLLVVPLPAWAVGSFRQVLVVGILVAVVIAILSRGGVMGGLSQRTGQRFRHPLITRIRDAAGEAMASGSVLRRPVDATWLVLLTTLIIATAILNNYLVLLALDLVLPVSASALLLVGLQVGVTLPSLPGTIGVFEYVCVVTLAVYGVERATAFSYGILLHALVMVPPTIVGLLFMLFGGASWRPPHAAVQPRET